MISKKETLDCSFSQRQLKVSQPIKEVFTKKSTTKNCLNGILFKSPRPQMKYL